MLSSADRRAVLRHYPVLDSMTVPDLDRALANAQVISLKAATLFFDELDRCRAFPFVLSGGLRVVKRSEHGREILLYSVAPGDACVVTAACLLGDRPYNAVGIVESDSQLVALPDADFDRLLMVKPFREYIFGLFSERVVGLMSLIDEVAFRRLDERLARVLIDAGPIVARSHQDLANELGTVREIVTRTLRFFADRGWVRLSRGTILVIDPEGLERGFVT